MLRYVKQMTDRRITLGQLRKLSKKDRFEIFRECQSFGAELRNTPAFFAQRRNELLSMCEQLSAPHVFATISHADTHCPYLHQHIVAWAQLAHPLPPPPSHEVEPKTVTFDNYPQHWLPARDDPFLEGLTKNERYLRRSANLRRYPHVVAQYFHHKTQLFISRIAESALGAEAHWCRYEWQSRGSTHVHFFLWLRDTPDLSFLDDWVQQAVVGYGDDAVLGDREIDDIVDELNARALNAALCPRTPQGALLPKDCECACHPKPEKPEVERPVACSMCDCGTVPDPVVPPEDETKEEMAARLEKGYSDDDLASRAALWWARLATRHNSAWDEEEKEPNVGREHPSDKHHVTVDKAKQSPEPVPDYTPCPHTTKGLPTALMEDRAEIANHCNRHTSCRASYCLRRDQHGKEFCRMHFPREIAEHNVPHFYCEKVKNGVRWKLYLPGNDPLMNSINPEQACAGVNLSKPG